MTWNPAFCTECRECSKPIPTEAELDAYRKKEEAEDKDDQPDETPGKWEDGKYIPNRIKPSIRTWNLVSSVFLIIYGTIGVSIDDLYLPSKRGPGVHLHGSEAWLMYAAFIAGSVNMLAVVIDHFDMRPNEALYDRIEKYANYVMYFFFAICIAIMFYHANHKPL